MNKIYSLVIAGLFCSASWAQTFIATAPDSIAYGPVSGDIELHVGNKIYNTSSTTPLDIDVVRVLNTVTPNWSTAFCLDICYAPMTDSVRFTVAPGDSVDFIFHFYTGATPDSGMAIMKVKDVNAPSNVHYQSFKAISQLGFSVNEHNANNVNLNLFPMPVCASEALNFEVSSGLKNLSNLVLKVYDVTGKEVLQLAGINEGMNKLNLNLHSGNYSFGLFDENNRVSSGKISVLK